MDTLKPESALVVIGQSIESAGRNARLITHVDQIQENGIYFYLVTESQIHTYGDPSFTYMKLATDWALQGKIHGLVTGPISKDKWIRAGIRYNGHTDMLARVTGVRNHCMFFWSKDMKVALFTIHIPLKDVFRHIEKDKIVFFIRFVDSELRRLFKKRFTFLVSGLNPHAGENGLMGTEELEAIIPAIDELKSDTPIMGPFPPDTIFINARETRDSVVISFYHDQGLIAFKLLNIHSGVNMTLGLPFIRTSPDHGTAYDIAGKGTANPSSMRQAIALAQYLVRQSAPDALPFDFNGL